MPHTNEDLNNVLEIVRLAERHSGFVCRPVFVGRLNGCWVAHDGIPPAGMEVIYDTVFGWYY